jgi:hypothetical protein
MNHSRAKTSNIQLRTPNAEHFQLARQGNWMLDVGCCGSGEFKNSQIFFLESQRPAIITV